MYDVLIIGCGVIGSAMAYTLSRYQLKVCVCERFNDVANGVTKATVPFCTPALTARPAAWRPA